MNELYEQTIEVNGRVYCYDPDHDLYYRSHHQAPETEFERWTKVAVALLLLLIVMLFSHFFLHN
jgi:hypothetical protein